MVHDPVVALLAEQPASRLIQMKDEIGQHIESLRVQHELVELALREKHQDTKSSRLVAQNAPAPTRGRQRPTYREILNTRPAHEWRPAEVHAELGQRGVEVTTSAVRVMLRRMGDDHEVVRGEHGWKLASRNGSSPEPSLGPSENGTSEPLLTVAQSQEGT